MAILPLIPVLAPPSQPGYGHVSNFSAALRGNWIGTSQGMKGPEPMIGLSLELTKQKWHNFGADGNDLLIGGMFRQALTRRVRTALTLPNCDELMESIFPFRAGRRNGR